MTFTGLKASRGNSKNFARLDQEIRWLNYDLSMLIVRDDKEKIAQIRNEIALKLQEINLISVK